MTYYALQFQYPRKGFISGGATFTPALDDYYNPNQTDIPPRTTAEVELDARLRKMDVDLFYTGTQAMVVSDDFKQLLEEWNVTASFIPTQVVYHNHVAVSGTYWIAHRLKLLDGVDYEQSTYAGKALVLRSIDNPPRRVAKGFEQILLDESKLEGNEFFQLDYTYIPNPIISEAFLNECKKQKLKLNATPINEFKP